MHSYKQLTFLLFLTFIFIGAVSVQAQTEIRVDTTQETEVRADSDTDEKCEAGDECPEESAERADANDADADGDGYGDVETNERCDDGVCTEADNAENNINICDGVTCSDGSCAATASECSGLEEEARGLDQKFQQVATSVSPVRDADSDGEGGGQSGAAGTDVTGEIILGEDRDMVMPGDNKSKAQGPDDADSDVDPEPAGRGLTKELDKASPKLMQALRIAEDSPLMGEGVELYLEDDVCDVDDEDCDDDSVSTSPSPRSLSMRVSGGTVRGWSPDQKAELARRLQAAGTSTTANDFGMRVAQAAVDNEDVSEIASDKNTTEVRFRTRMRLFGLIPTRANATARAETGGEVEVDYPWYGFLASKGDSSIFSSLASELRAAHDVMVSPVNDPPQVSDE